MMQTGIKAVDTVKETTSNIAASAVSGLDKTKATMQEKVAKMRANDEYDKGLAAEKKQERLTEAELRKQQAMSHNAAAKNAKSPVAGHTGTNNGTGLFGGSGTNTTTTGTHTHSTTGLHTGAHQSHVPGHGTGAHQSHVLGHETDAPVGGFVEDGTIESHPTTGASRTTAATTRHTGHGV